MVDRPVSPTIESPLQTAIAGLRAELHSVNMNTQSSTPADITLPPLDMEPRQNQSDISPSSSRAATFLASLPTIALKDLPDNSQDCHICKESFEDPDPHAPDSTEVPVKLPCNHIMGSSCLATWVRNNNNNNTCPMCRAVLFNRWDSSMVDELSHVDERALDADREALLALEVENREILTQLAPGTRGSRGEVPGLTQRFAGIDAELEAIQVRMREARRRIERLEAQG